MVQILCRVRRPAMGLVICFSAWPWLATAAEVQLKNGTVLVGGTAPLKSLTDDSAGASRGDPILVVNDQLRRYYVPRLQIDVSRPGGLESLEKFIVPQPGKTDGGAAIGWIGFPFDVDDWDEFGRRIYRAQVARGPVDVIQCITEITPQYTQAEAYKNFQWMARTATTSLPPETLQRMILKAIDPKRLEHRLRVVRFYLQLNRFHVAEAELEKVLKDFPAAADDYRRALRELKQLAARRALEEIKARRGAGQHRLAHALLKNFPSKDAAGEILPEVAKELNDVEGQMQRRSEIVQRLNAEIQALVAAESTHKPALEAIGRAIAAELSLDTLDRMAAYHESATDPAATREQRVALAISGWSQGPKGAINNLGVALSMYQVRALVHEYFNCEHKIEREEVARKLKVREGATAQRLAQLLAHMKPPKETHSAKGDPKQPRDGLFELEVEDISSGLSTTYYVQLPPEYDPYRRYPVVVTLYGLAIHPERRTDMLRQLDWWAGDANERGERRGQAGRHGYIVIAPDWGQPKDRKYEFSRREHVAVLSSLRDACRRFSIDTDRVFLHGHYLGGTAAWDIALSHPDLFAGLIVVSGVSEKYCDLYWQNARYLPIYFVCGEKDRALAASARSLDRYLRATPPLDVIVAEYLGRGLEEFSDELLQLFAWMGRHRRDFARRDFRCASKRPWDNSFWWLELVLLF